MNAMQRVLTAMSHREPDRVPLFLLTTMHGARELGLTIREYFSRAEYVVEGQLRLLAKYRSDCLYPFTCAAVEAEAFGAEIVFIEDGPPNAGAPILRRREQIDRLEAPRVAGTAGLLRTLETIRLLRERVDDTVPIFGAVVSPFSLPVMQMGFGPYIELLYEEPERLARLMAVNAAFCVEWANAQLAAGATAIGMSDPLSSTTILPRDLYLRTGHPVIAEVIGKIKGPTAIHLASGRGLSIVADLAATGAVAVGVSALESLADWKAAAGDGLTLIGNLNGVEMRHWTELTVEHEVRRAITEAGRGGGFVLADNHGEIPWQVPDGILLAIREAVDRWGTYPLARVG